MRISIGFKLKRSKKRNDETIPVYVNIILNRRRVELSTRIFVSPNNWDQAKERVSGTSNKAKTINNRLDKMATNILDIYNQF
jgi:guanylate kinase